MISRDIMYKARYSLGRLMDAPDPRLSWTFIELGLRDWFVAIHRLMNAQPRLDSIEYVEGFLEKLNIRNKYEFAWAIRNLLNNINYVKVVRRDDKGKYAMDIIAFQLWYAKDCQGWPWGETVSANNHLPTLLIILWRYLNDCVKPQEQRRRQQQQQVRPTWRPYTGWDTAKPQYTYNYSNYDNNYYNNNTG
jgi:hypothetical protein